MNFFQKLETTRKPWQPNNPAANSELSKLPLTISRCLSLTDLEPAVAGFISEGLNKNDTTKIKEAIPSLQKNILDEVTHEIALNRAKSAMSNYTNAFEGVSKSIIQSWKDLTDNPITIAAVLENGVFFVILPIYSQFGHTSLRITSASISSDERIHVQSHRAAAQLLGAKPSKALNNLRRDTVAWLSESLKEDQSPWSADRLLRNSDMLMKKGVSDLIETQVSNVNAPFELNNNSMDSYN